MDVEDKDSDQQTSQDEDTPTRTTASFEDQQDFAVQQPNLLHRSYNLCTTQLRILVGFPPTIWLVTEVRSMIFSFFGLLRSLVIQLSQYILPSLSGLLGFMFILWLLFIFSSALFRTAISPWLWPFPILQNLNSADEGMLLQEAMNFGTPLDDSVHPLITITQSGIDLLPVTMIINLAALHITDARDIVEASELTLKLESSQLYAKLEMDACSCAQELRLVSSELTYALREASLQLFGAILILESYLKNEPWATERVLSSLLSILSRFSGNSFLFHADLNWVDRERRFRVRELGIALQDFLVSFETVLRKLTASVTRAAQSIKLLEDTAGLANVARLRNERLVQLERSNLDFKKSQSWNIWHFLVSPRLDMAESHQLHLYDMEIHNLQRLSRAHTSARSTINIILVRLGQLEDNLIKLGFRAKTVRRYGNMAPCYGCWNVIDFDQNLILEHKKLQETYEMLQNTMTGFNMARETDANAWRVKEASCFSSKDFISCMVKQEPIVIVT